MTTRGLAAALNGSKRFRYKSPEAVVDHLIVGGGVIGLSIAEKLCQIYPEKSTYLVERHSRAGEETSSRNSEVIHAGIYYPSNSLKTRLCLQGRKLLYKRCREQNIPYKRIGKLIVAGSYQRTYLEKLLAKMKTIEGDLLLPSHLQLLTGDEAREMEPNLSSHIHSAILSPETGIIDSHSLIESFEKSIGESEAGALVYSTKVVRVDPYYSARHLSSGWVVQIATSQGNGKSTVPEEVQTDSLLAKTLINASGLNGNLILNSLLPSDKRISMYYAGGSYAVYRGPGVDHVSRLIYPVPDLAGAVNLDPTSFQSLGTHLTVDLEGNIRFGPNIEWLSPPGAGPLNKAVDHPSAIDFWMKHLIADEKSETLAAMHRAITTYLPSISLEGLKPDYVGIRPKLVGPMGGFRDFNIRVDFTEDFGGNRGSPMISLLGIESPGLTACLSIANYVVTRLGEIFER